MSNKDHLDKNKRGDNGIAAGRGLHQPIPGYSVDKLWRR
jgi:hypothetical protein